jgi:hypothetical protein
MIKRVCGDDFNISVHEKICRWPHISNALSCNHTSQAHAMKRPVSSDPTIPLRARREYVSTQDNYPTTKQSNNLPFYPSAALNFLPPLLCPSSTHPRNPARSPSQTYPPRPPQNRVPSHYRRVQARKVPSARDLARRPVLDSRARDSDKIPVDLEGLQVVLVSRKGRGDLDNLKEQEGLDRLQAREDSDNRR